MRKRSGPSMLLMLIGAFIPTVADSAALKCEYRPRHIILMRHGCKADTKGVDDKLLPLCVRGQEQAKELVKRVAEYGITTVYVTTKLRSRETAAALGIEPMKPWIEPTPAGARTLMQCICSNPASEGTTILHVGHSETLDDALDVFGLSRDIPGYADGWVISFDGAGKPTPKALLSTKIKCGNNCAP